MQLTSEWILSVLFISTDLHSVLPCSYYRDLSKQFWCPLYGIKNSIFNWVLKLNLHICIFYFFVRLILHVFVLLLNYWKLLAIGIHWNSKCKDIFSDQNWEILATCFIHAVVWLYSRSSNDHFRLELNFSLPPP